ncbi:MAG: putative GTP-binding protein EngB [Thermocaproicibacter melissae]|jgi:GTP-binding protein|uniref:ribosome biogenesis GTP-binding protein YihA/YsxC n=1 Tax=Thermocaproicibacter melissae TaxID=2966552 RepID=UPI0024B0F3A1|nr:ribosome biogenesis GTP-binding protein YihA/YsxC [Thermocaproicibacter melissae]WBY64656.1 ribosome biogenesis GTP-binding protein YihA/YsxC [Thermocaproicibacter melissae]
MNFQNAFFETAAGTSAGLPQSTLPEIVFSGRSNVGKSSMINKLLNRKSLAHVSSSPGKTSTINFYNVGFCRFADLPGYGYAKVTPAEKQRWAELIEGYFAQERDFRLVVQIIDMRRDPTDDDMAMLAFLRSREIPFLIAASKSDKLNATQRAKMTSVFQKIASQCGTEFVPFSAISGEGVEQIQKKILSVCEK